MAPEVVGLPGRHAVLQHVRSHGGVVTDGERYELLLAAAADQLQQVTARQPVLRDVERDGGSPRARHRGGAGGEDRGGLGLRGDEVCLYDEAAPEALVVAHPVHLRLDGAGRGVDEQGDVVAGHRTHLTGESLQRVVGLDVVADPVQGAGLGVLGDQPRRRRHDDAARELGVDHGGEVLLPVAAGPGRHAVLRVRGLQARGRRRTRRHRARRAAGTAAGRWVGVPGRGAESEPPSGGRGCTSRAYPTARVPSVQAGRVPAARAPSIPA